MIILIDTNDKFCAWIMSVWYEKKKRCTQWETIVKTNKIVMKANEGPVIKRKNLNDNFE